MEEKTPTSKDFKPVKKNKLDGFKRWIKKRPPKKRLAIVSGVSAGILFFGAAASFTLIKDESVVYDPGPITSNYVAPAIVYKSPLTGMATDEASTKRPITSIMIENSIDARPQSGLSSAGIVFGAIAEGGITRFLALYQESRPGTIGPVRSARPYYVEWAKGFDSQYVHVGGSPEGLALVRSLGIKDLDQSTYGDRIASRVSYRFAPHNMYTDFDRIDQLSTELGYGESTFTPLVRKDDPEVLPTKTAGNIEFNISSQRYNTSYTYNPELNNYNRFMAGTPHLDQDGEKQITPKVVIALIASYSIHPNGIHSQYGSIGSGEAIIFQDGTSIKGTWNKPTRESTINFVDAVGTPIPLNAGQTWITAIAPGRVTFTP